MYILTKNVLLLTVTLTNDTPDFSSDRAPNMDNTVALNSLTVTNAWSRATDGAQHRDTLTV
jgi:hypothetical protein